MNLPPLNFNNASGAGTGEMWSNFATDTNGGSFSVNYGNGVSQGGGQSGGISPLMLFGALILGVVLWKRST